MNDSEGKTARNQNPIALLFLRKIHCDWHSYKWNEEKKYKWMRSPCVRFPPVGFTAVPHLRGSNLLCLDCMLTHQSSSRTVMISRLLTAKAPSTHTSPNFPSPCYCCQPNFPTFRMHMLPPTNTISWILSFSIQLTRSTKCKASIHRAWHVDMLLIRPPLHKIISFSGACSCDFITTFLLKPQWSQVIPRSPLKD